MSAVSTENRSAIITPGATVGVLGGGQLGRMLGTCARRMGYGIQVFGDAPDSPAAQLSDRTWTSAFDDYDQLQQFASRVDVVTYEQENIPVSTVRALSEWVPVRPGAALLEAAQHRLLEKSALRRIGIPTADFRAIRSVDELRKSLQNFGNRGILKTVTQGYDGKGQLRLNAHMDLSSVWRSFDAVEAILEQEISFRQEMSVVATRFLDRSIVAFSPSLNIHVNHILDVSVSPSPLISPTVAAQAQQIAAAILEHFDVTGVLCVEFFLTEDDQLLVNEIAPRPHNSGHLTIEACGSSQFEQQLRAVCGMPSGDVRQRQPAAMVNLLGDHLMQASADRWHALFARPNVSVHLYGKGESRPGRKMGHLTVLAETASEARQQALAARSLLTGIDD